jgi:putative NAD(P)-binding protein
VTPTTPIHVVGAGIAGLAAAITAAEAGAPVVLHEASDRVGGRALSADGPYMANLGPHVVYRGGAVTRFVRDRRLPVRLRPPVARGWRVIDERGTHSAGTLLPALAALRTRRAAPADVEFSTWVTRSFGEHIGSQLRHLAGLYTFHHDPGGLAAEFVWEGCRRSLGRPETVRYVDGGWSSLVAALERAARARGVHIRLASTVDRLPEDGPVIIAVPNRRAARLVGRELEWPTARTALLDVALRDAAGMPSIVLDLSPDLRGCVLAERFTAVDPSLAPPGVELLQAQLGVDPATGADDAVARLERTLDAFGHWRPREVWRRSMIVEGASGAVDPVGTSWRDRPAIDQGDGRFLAGDAVAAPGLLSEVSVNSGVRAAHLALAERTRRRWAPGWPTVELDARARARVLAAVLPGATLESRVVDAPIDRAWTVEPVREAEPYRTRSRRLGITRIAGADPRPDGTTCITTVRVGRRRPPAGFTGPGTPP